MLVSKQQTSDAAQLCAVHVGIVAASGVGVVPGGDEPPSAALVLGPDEPASAPASLASGVVSLVVPLSHAVASATASERPKIARTVVMVERPPATCRRREP